MIIVKKCFYLLTGISPNSPNRVVGYFVKNIKKRSRRTSFFLIGYVFEYLINFAIEKCA